MRQPSYGRGWCHRARSQHARSIEAKGLIVEEAALVLDQERRIAFDAPGLFVGRMVLCQSDVLRAAFEVRTPEGVVCEVLSHSPSMGELAGRVDAAHLGSFPVPT